MKHGLPGHSGPGRGSPVVHEHDDARPVTIYTVAERAGVSIATVSRVLSGSTPASVLTRKRVLRAVEDLEYVPLRAGRAVDVPSHQTHGTPPSGPARARLLRAAVGLRVHGGPATAGRLVVVVCDASKDAEASVRKILGRIDGIVIANDTISDAMVRQIVALDPDGPRRPRRHRGLRRRAGRELHQFARADPAPARPWPHAGSSSSATPSTSHDVSERYRGFQHALERKRGAEAARPDPGPVRGDVRTARPRVRCTRRRRPAPTIDALVGANDEPRSRRWSCSPARAGGCPDDVAVVGFDDIMTSRYLAPGLTTVQQPMRELGAGPRSASTSASAAASSTCTRRCSRPGWSCAARAAATGTRRPSPAPDPHSAPLPPSSAHFPTRGSVHSTNRWAALLVECPLPDTPTSRTSYA